MGMPQQSGAAAKIRRDPLPVPAPCAAGAFKDGSVYLFPDSAQWSPTSYSRVALVDRAAIKLASDYGESEYVKFVVQETRDDDAIRSNETLEKFANLVALVDKYPAFRACPDAYGDRNTHWLLIHKLQFERLRKIASRSIPDARFVFLSRKRFLLSPAIHPALVQERVSGLSLMDMIDHEAIAAVGGHTQSFAKEEFSGHLRDIAEQLAPFTEPNATNHINWYIPNFIFDPVRRTLFYIDMKPSNIFGKWRNEQNLRNIRRDFMQIWS
jgi:hypothetical protein